MGENTTFTLGGAFSGDETSPGAGVAGPRFFLARSQPEFMASLLAS